MWRIVLFCSIALSACAPDEEDRSSIATTHSIAAIKRLYGGASELLSEDIYITGVVTANDVLGEISNAIVLDDGSAAIELCCEADNLFLSYPVGMELTIRCGGLWLSSDALGGEPDDDYAVSRIAEEEIERVIIPGELVEPLTPIVTTIDALSKDLVMRTVLINNVIFLPNDATTTLCERDSTSGQVLWTKQWIEDEAGEQISLFFSSEIKYPDEPIPSTRGAVSALVELHGSQYQLRIVNHGLYF